MKKTAIDQKTSILILSAWNKLAPRVKLISDALEREGYKIETLYISRISWSVKTFLGLILYYARIIRACFAKHIWAVHLTHIAQIPISPVLKIRGIKVVYDAYERYSVDISELHFKGYLKDPIRRFIEVFENLIVLLFIDAVFVVSTPNEYLRQRYSKYCKLVECLYNVPSKLSVFGGDLDKKFNEECLRVAYVGGVWPQKGSKRLIPIAKLLRNRGNNFELHVIGDFEDDFQKQKLLRDAQEHELSDKVFVHGYMDYPSMLSVLCKCHIGLNLTSNTERLALMGIGSSRKNYTYMSAGMAVITASVGQMAYAIEEENCGIVIEDADDFNAIASAIQKLAKNRKDALMLAKNGIQAIVKRYNWEGEAEKLLRTYCQLYYK